MQELFLGVDAGASTTRALLATERGAVIGFGRSGGANMWSSGTSVWDVIGAAVGQALHGADPSSITSSVVALAGSLTGGGDAADAASAWQRLGLPQGPHVVSDVLAGFAAGSTAPNGTVLVAGTGSIAAAIRDREVARTSGGHGWLLGDQGSAVWLGLEGMRAALRALDGTGPDSLLVRNVPLALGIDASSRVPTRVAIVREAHGRPPAALGRLAPVVVDAAAGGDPVAQALLHAAVDHLVELVASVVAPDSGGDIILTGSLLTTATPVGRSVRTRLADRWPAAVLREAISGEPGAVVLAIERHTRKGADAALLPRLRAGVAARDGDRSPMTTTEAGPAA
jgi:N-acetylglucosamine kinase-like BadF-type ATPase